MNSHYLPSPHFDWDRLQVRNFCLKMVNDFDWDFCYDLYIKSFVKQGWSFEKFRMVAEYDGVWNNSMLRLEKLHRFLTLA